MFLLYLKAARRLDAYVMISSFYIRAMFQSYSHLEI